MKNKAYFGFLLLWIGNAFAAPLTLREAFEASKSNMESIKRAKANTEVFEEQKVRARAAALPTVNGVGTFTRIDQPETPSGSTSPFLLVRQYNYAIRLTQPILRGGIYSAYQLAQENILLAKYQQDATELNLYQLVINAFHNFAIAQNDVKNVEELLKYSRERVKEIKERTAIGISRRGELVEAESQLHIAESQFHQTVINLKQSQKNLEFFIGRPVEEVENPLTVPVISQNMQDYITLIRTRPDILAAEQQTRVADKRVEIAKGGHYPSVDFISNYYLKRTGVLATSDWDVGVAIVVPLFQGGGVQAQVREAVEAKRIATLTTEETKRAAERDMIINFQNYNEIMAQLKSLKTALQKSEEAYQLNRRDYKNGLVTNLDVLQSLNVFIETKRSYDSLVTLANLNYKNLEASSGVLP